jgi:hypothetical protein
MTIQDFAADQTERMAASLAHFVVTTDPSRLRWEMPTEGGGHTRSILDQVAECVEGNRRFAALMRGELAPGPTPAPSFTDTQDAKAQLVSSAGELAVAIRAVAGYDLETLIQTPRGSAPIKNLMLAAYRNMAYHAGQINFIQILAGDAEFHSPPTWL